MIKFEDFYFASRVGIVSANTGERIDVKLAEQYVRAGFVVKEFEPAPDFMIKVWLEKGEE